MAVGTEPEVPGHQQGKKEQERERGRGTARPGGSCGRALGSSLGQEGEVCGCPRPVSMSPEALGPPNALIRPKRHIVHQPGSDGNACQV